MPGRAASSPRYLVARLSSFGDVVLAEPVVRRLKAADPRCDVTFATYEEYAAIPAMFAGVDRVMPLERGAGSRGPAAADGRTWDIAVDLQNNLRSWRLLARLKPRRVLRYRRQYARRLLRVYAPRLWRGSLKHTVEIYLEALKPLGIEAGRVPPSIVVPPGELSAASARLGTGSLVGVCPGGSSPHKMWGRQRFAALVDLLAAGGSRVVVVGGECDRAEVEAVAGAARAGAPLTFISDGAGAVAAALALCEVVVSNDSGLMHLAGAVGAKVVGIFGPTSPDLGFAPLAPGAVVSRDASCSPCSYHGNRPCHLSRAFCLEDIEPREVCAVVGRVSANGR